LSSSSRILFIATLAVIAAGAGSSTRDIKAPEGIIEILKKHYICQQETKKAIGGAYNEFDLICCNEDGKPYDPKYFSNKFRKFILKKGLKRIRSLSFRSEQF